VLVEDGAEVMFRSHRNLLKSNCMVTFVLQG
jgi:hypothetical protein